MDVVIVRPLIPQNTVFIAKMCVATDSRLCIVGEPGFAINDQTIADAGLHFWSVLRFARFTSFADYLQQRGPGSVWFVETSGVQRYDQARFGANDAIVFGSETVGLPPEILSQGGKNVLCIPMRCEGVRSLNLSNAVAIVLFEAQRQLGTGSRKGM